MLFKRILLIIASIVLAFGTTELIVAHCIGYPPYGVEYKVAYRVGGSTWTNIRKPNAKLYNVEGKTITWVNNLGLPGSEIDNFETPIVLLGSSYVEAFQYEPNDIASSLFQNRLYELGYRRPVLNLGCSGHDPYDSWFRLKYFENKLGFQASDVILVINSDNQDWFARHPQPFTFDLPEGFGRKNDNFKMALAITARNSSSLVEIFAKTLLKGDGLDGDDQAVNNKQDTIQKAEHDYQLSREMKDCLKAFSNDYPRFMVVSTAGDVQFNSALEEYCRSLDIKISIAPLNNPHFMIRGAGHLNRDGNNALADALLSLWVATK